MKRLLQTTLAVAALAAASIALAQTPPGAATPTAPAGETYTPPTESADTGPSAEQLDAQRLAVWNSPDMTAARKWIADYERVSKQFTQQDAERYLAQLRQASPEQMKIWLARFKANRESSARSESVAKTARQTAVDQTVARLQAVQQSYENLNANQTFGAQVAADRYREQQQYANELGAGRQASRAAQADADRQMRDYSWIVNPPWFVRAAAGATLPGDLPRGDPANFIRGDVPIPGEGGAANAAAAAAAGAGAAAAAAGAGAGAGGGGGR